MSPQESYLFLIDQISWIDTHFTDIELPADERSLLAIGCLDITIEHQAAVALLHNGRLYGSMFALLRAPYESLVRGLWLLRCADDQDLLKFKNGRLDLKQKELVERIEKMLQLKGSALSIILDKAWKAMNGFTHTGFVQVSRRHTEGEVRANYPETEIVQALNLTRVFGLVAAGVLAELSGRQDLVQAAVYRMSSCGSK